MKFTKLYGVPLIYLEIERSEIYNTIFVSSQPAVQRIY